MARSTPAADVASSPENPEEVPAVSETQVRTDAEAAQRSMIDRMKVHFASQPKRRVKVRNDGPVTVQVNGYSFLIQENVPVDVPSQVADMLDEAGYI